MIRMGRSRTMRGALELKFIGNKPMDYTQQDDSAKQSNTLEKRTWQGT